MEEIIIYKQKIGSDTRDVYQKFKFDNNLYESKESQFASIMWKKLVSKQFGFDYAYMRSYYDYTNFYHRDNYVGEAIYHNGLPVMRVEDLYYGMHMIVVGDNIYSV